MASIEFETLVTTHLRDTGGRIMKIMTVSAISGPYTTGGVEIAPADLDLKSIDFLAIQGLFALPEALDFQNGEYGKTVDIFTTKVDADLTGDAVWKMIVFLYAMDSIELPDGIEMEFVPQLPITALVIGSKDR